MEPLFLCLALLGVERATSARPLGAVDCAVRVRRSRGDHVRVRGRAAARPAARRVAVFVGLRARWRWVLTAWAAFAVTQVPLLAYTRLHPGALSGASMRRPSSPTTCRLGRSRGGPPSTTSRTSRSGTTSSPGDVKPYAHTPGTGALLGASLALSVAGSCSCSRGYRTDPFWRFARGGARGVARSRRRHHRPVPRGAADPFAVMLVVLAIPAVDGLRDAAVTRHVGAGARRSPSSSRQRCSSRFFVHSYATNGPLRTGRFEAEHPAAPRAGLVERWDRLRRLRRP